MAAACSHLDAVQLERLPPRVDGCEDCLRTGGKWVHLRICLTCGHVGCCDSSPGRHASRHAREAAHPLLRSIEPEEDWSWCAIDEIAMILDRPTGHTTIPPSPLLS